LRLNGILGTIFARDSLLLRRVINEMKSVYGMQYNHQYLYSS
jgi:hypothetical protein